MTSSQWFKFGFLLRCAEEGLTQPEIDQRITQASGLLKQADGLVDKAVGSAMGLGLYLPAGLSIAGGAGAGYLASKLTQPSVTPDDAKAQELITTYRQYADYLRRHARTQQLNAKAKPRRFAA